ncbi:Inner membrane protein alx [bacterium HR15]|nr:Inner membrane protein alx [bacterium HR15]
MEITAVFWLIFGLVVSVCIAIDLFVFHREAHTVRFREALGWVLTWIVLAALFNLGVYVWHGKQRAVEFLAAYLVELSLSVDNLFVFLVIFRYFRVPAAYQHRVLFWGVIGALVMRAIFILVGLTLLRLFHWMVYVFGAILIFTGFRLVLKPSEEVEIERNLVLRLARYLIPITPDYRGAHYFVRWHGRLAATPLFITLLIVESTDLLFALDSIPAALAISQDPFVVYTSNAFAVLGLRSLYFVLSRFIGAFAYLHYGLALILAFIGVKMILSPIYKIPVGWSLGVIAMVLSITIALSLIFPPREASEAEELQE